MKLARSRTNLITRNSSQRLIEFTSNLANGGTLDPRITVSAGAPTPVWTVTMPDTTVETSNAINPSFTIKGAGATRFTLGPAALYSHITLMEVNQDGLTDITGLGNLASVLPNVTDFRLHLNAALSLNVSGWVLPASLKILLLQTTGISGNISGWVLPAGMIAINLSATSGASGIPDISQNTAMTDYQRNSSSMSVADMAATIRGIYERRAAFSFAAPLLVITGANAVPSGIYQDVTTPTTAMEYLYKIANDPDGEGFNTWSVSFPGGVVPDAFFADHWIETLSDPKSDLFVDASKTSAISGVSRSIIKPTKSGSNPLFEVAGANTATWDHDKNYCHVLEIGGTYYMWYAGLEADGTPGPLCYATSADGITWTKPNLGLVTYAGNTNNNIILNLPSGGVSNPSVVYNAGAAAGWEYLIALEQHPADTKTLNLYRSADGINLTFVQSLDSSAMHREVKALVQTPSGKWMLYYSFHHSAQLRQIGVYQSVTTDPSGDWFDRFVVIPTTISTEQKYTLGIEVVGDTFIAAVADYNSTTGQMNLDLYISHDGLNWTRVDEDWLPIGVSGTFDDEFITNGKSLIKVGNDWRFYYPGFPTKHSGPLPFDSRIGLATLGYRRAAQVAGTGSVTTVAITPGVDEKLYINCDASGGKIEVEVLSSGSPLASFTQADADDVTTDTYETEVTWGAASLPTGSEIQIKFYLTDATLYSFEVK